LEITRWVADYYAAPWGEVLKAALPAGLNATVEQILSITPEGRDELARLPIHRTATARARALRLVAENAALAAQEFNRAFVLMQYFGYLRRNPDDVGFDGQPDPNFTGYNFWLSKLNEFGDYRAAEMVKAFITSIEYRRRFGPA
jgi:hypothetical protein